MNQSRVATAAILFRALHMAFIQMQDVRVKLERLRQIQAVTQM